MGIPEVVGLALPAIFHGLNVGLGVVVEEGVAFKLAVVVVLADTAITVDALSVYLLVMLVVVAVVEAMVMVEPLSGWVGVLVVEPSAAIVVMVL